MSAQLSSHHRELAASLHDVDSDLRHARSFVLQCRRTRRAYAGWREAAVAQGFRMLQTEGESFTILQGCAGHLPQDAHRMQTRARFRIAQSLQLTPEGDAAQKKDRPLNPAEFPLSKAFRVARIVRCVIRH